MLNATTRMRGACEIEKGWFIAFFHQTFCDDKTVIALDHYFSPIRNIRSHDGRELIMETFPSPEHFGEIEFDLSS